MQRVLVIGPCGAGKSTVAVELGRVLDLPVHHLDQLHWRDGWVESSREELLQTLEPIVAGERWLIDGNYGGTMAGRIERADAVVYLDYPTWLCLWRVSKRLWRYRGRARPDMAPGCPERFDLEFFLYVLNFRRGRVCGLRQGSWATNTRFCASCTPARYATGSTASAKAHWPSRPPSARGRGLSSIRS